MHLDGMKTCLNSNMKWDARFVKGPCYETNNKMSGRGQLFFDETAGAFMSYTI